MLKDLLPNFI